MVVLALETSTLLGGVAVIQDGKVLSSESSRRQKGHSEILHPFIETCLQRASLKLTDIDVFAVGQGPGSFTGIRVAANAGKALAYIYKKPLVTVDSLMLLAAPVKSKLPVLAIMNAYKNMVYFGLFDVSGDEPVYLNGPLAIPVLNLKSLVDQNVLVVGDGHSTYQEYFAEDLKPLFHRDDQYQDHPQVETLGLMAEKRARNGQTMEWNSFLPLYIRASEAEENKRGIVISPLK
jgi:N6-L-threonylcarbamoyladenine synthase/tRNA threonylcarbamoyladenosine biosynthesis protein TsaB